MITTFEEETDCPLPEYPLPEQIERLIEATKYSNVENSDKGEFACDDEVRLYDLSC